MTMYREYYHDRKMIVILNKKCYPHTHNQAARETDKQENRDIGGIRQIVRQKKKGHCAARKYRHIYSGIQEFA